MEKGTCLPLALLNRSGNVLVSVPTHSLLSELSWGALHGNCGWGRGKGKDGFQTGKNKLFLSPSHTHPQGPGLSSNPNTEHDNWKKKILFLDEETRAPECTKLLTVVEHRPSQLQGPTGSHHKASFLCRPSPPPLYSGPRQGQVQKQPLTTACGAVLGLRMGKSHVTRLGSTLTTKANTDDANSHHSRPSTDCCLLPMNLRPS